MNQPEIPPCQVLVTERLKLRELNPEIYNHILSWWSGVDIKSWFGYKTDEEVEQERERFRQGMTMAGRSFLLFHLLERSTDRTLGWCGYHTWFTAHRRAEIGYVLNDESAKGKGYMGEALPQVIRHGFETMNLHRIEALVGTYNEPSLKLIRKNGFREEGVLREHYLRNGVYEDSMVFGQLRPEYTLNQIIQK
jgi:ribosomal-protein-alanine N-acetyltransferase